MQGKRIAHATQSNSDFWRRPKTNMIVHVCFAQLCL